VIGLHWRPRQRLATLVAASVYRDQQRRLRERLVDLQHLVADQQPDGEQHACLLQFLGLAERIYTDEYGQLVGLKMEAEKLKADLEEAGGEVELK
jgi:hypothetical protein